MSLLAHGCPSHDERCQICNGERCEFCVYSYPGADGICVEPALVIDGCYSYSADGVCQKCDYGHLSLDNGTCWPLDRNLQRSCIMSYVSQSYCSICRDSTLTTDGHCPGDRPCADPHCNYCYMRDGQELCYKCKPGYRLTSPTNGSPAQCVAETAATANCFQSDSDSYCVDCDINYYYNQGMCWRTRLTEMKPPGSNSVDWRRVCYQLGYHKHSRYGHYSWYGWH